MKAMPLLGVLIAGVPLVMLNACDQGSDPSESEVVLRPVRTLLIETGGTGSWRELPAVVDAVRKADLSFRIAGKLQELLAGESDIVERDQLLARLDGSDLEIQVRSRQAEYDQAHADFLRGQTLVDKGVISRSDFEKLQAQDVSARASLESARQNLDYTYLRAPFDGLIAKRHVENFEDVAAGQGIYTLQDTSSLILKVGVPETMMIRIRREANPNVYAVFDAIPDQRFPLSVKEVSLQADERTNTFEVTLSMNPDPRYNILPGMSATVRGEPQAAADSAVVYIPPHAALEDSEGTYVFIVEPTGDERGVVERRPVKTAGLSNLGLEIVSGLGAGDRLVTAGMSKMFTGLEVKLLPEGGE